MTSHTNYIHNASSGSYSIIIILLKYSHISIKINCCMLPLTLQRSSVKGQAANVSCLTDTVTFNSCKEL